MSNLQTNCCLKIISKKLDQYTAGKWLIHSTENRKVNQLQSLESPVEYGWWLDYWNGCLHKQCRDVSNVKCIIYLWSLFSKYLFVASRDTRELFKKAS